jgi:hypothetical protein
MSSFNHTTCTPSARSSVIFMVKGSIPVLPLLLFVFILIAHARGDEYTGMAQDDSKNMIPLQDSRSQSTGLFLPLPSWSHLVSLPPLPDVLKPMGKRPAVAANPEPAPAPLAPPRETTPVSVVTTTGGSNPKPTPPANNNSPTLIAVSPFLQWIQANPQAAAAEARQEANGYHAPTGSAAGSPGPDVPYWLPPMIDSTGASSQSSGGSAAIYSTPQR